MDKFSITEKSVDTAIFGAGCFWCTEAVFSRLKGVLSVTPGYSGGNTQNPTYEQVCTGLTGHAEVARIIFDTTLISYNELLQVFWQMHDPTSLNRQGADRGTQYRSVIFYLNDSQRDEAIFQKDELSKSGEYTDPVVTEISPVSKFYPAEDYHRDYYSKNANAPYCQIVISPKLEKIHKLFDNMIQK